MLKGVVGLVTVLFVANEVWRLWAESRSPARILLYLLPPVHRTGDVYGLLAREGATALPWTSIAWLTGYGALCLVLGMAVIRRRPLGTN